MTPSRPLSLHHLSLMELSPVELIHVAAKSGFNSVCLFVQSMAGLDFPVVTRSNATGVSKALRETGVSVYNLEIFPLGPDNPVSSHFEALALGAELGGGRATALIVGDAESDDLAIDQFGEFCSLTASLGIQAGLEFMAFTSVRTIDHAMSIIRSTGHSNGTLALDALHLMRNGVGPGDLDRLQISPQDIGYIQFCDGPKAIEPENAFDEATRNRTAPGDGAFPLGAFLAHLPAERTLSLECPMERLRESGSSALERAEYLLQSARSVLDYYEGRA